MSAETTAAAVGRTTPQLSYAPPEILTSAPTRAAKYKWAIVVNTDAAPGLAINAVACIAASTGSLVDGLIARGGPDGDGHFHPGLPWAGCTVLGAGRAQMSAARTEAVSAGDVLVVDMPSTAQVNRVYDDYLRDLSRATAAELDLIAFSVIGPRNRVDKITKKLDLLS
jgi:hypothetical protein